ncbi:unnamed protein product [Linum trigynum]|uniref:Uncharacterized protein n=1 Tax=Linum trigynum TaxID=586398 RepID=A0AAV2E7F3_9ROSI
MFPLLKSVREGRDSVNLLERIEKLEEDLRSTATIVRVLSRQLEKLGIRFRLTRKALKEPIAELATIPWMSPPMHLLKEIFRWKLMKMKKVHSELQLYGRIIIE